MGVSDDDEDMGVGVDDMGPDDESDAGMDEEDTDAGPDGDEDAGT